jgi:hypothetical protein
MLLIRKRRMTSEKSQKRDFRLGAEIRQNSRVIITGYEEKT